MIQHSVSVVYHPVYLRRILKTSFWFFSCFFYFELNLSNTFDFYDQKSISYSTSLNKIILKINHQLDMLNLLKEPLSTKLTTIFILLSLALITSPQTLAVKRKVPQKLGLASQCKGVGPNGQTIMGFGNCFQNIYYINIGVGTPPQYLGAILDTGSDIMWVPTQYVANATFPVFHTNQSSTFKNTSSRGGVQYVDGSGVSGTYGVDVFYVQGTPINTPVYYLWVINETQMDLPEEIQGLIGMGSNIGFPNFLDYAYKAGQIKSPIFALQIMNETMDSIIYYNQIPQQIKNETVFVPVADSTYWGVQVLRLSVGDLNLTANASNIAIIDSGTSYFYINYALYYQVQRNFFSDCIYNQGYPQCPCSSVHKWPNFTFYFQNVKVSINSTQYAYNITTDTCTYLFGSIPGFEEILLGDIFFRGYIVTFDKINSQIGFGPQRAPPSAINITDTQKSLSYAIMGVAGGIFLFSILVAIKIPQELFDLKDKYQAIE